LVWPRTLDKRSLPLCDGSGLIPDWTFLFANFASMAQPALTCSLPGLQGFLPPQSHSYTLFAFPLRIIYVSKGMPPPIFARRLTDVVDRHLVSSFQVSLSIGAALLTPSDELPGFFLGSLPHSPFFAEPTTGP